MNRIFDKERKEAIIWICNIGVEKKWFGDIKIFEVQKSFQDNCYSNLNILLCKKQDYIILRKKSDSFYLKQLKKLGCEIPKFLYINEKIKDQYLTEAILHDDKLLKKMTKLSKKKISLLCFGNSTYEEKLSEITGIKLLGPSNELNILVNDKVFSYKLADKINFNIPEWFTTKAYNDILKWYDKLNNNEIILKYPKSSSGQLMFIVKDNKQLTTVINLLNRKFKNEEIIVQKWINNAINYNYQFLIEENGKIEFLIYSKQIVENLVYKGSLFYFDEKLENEFKGFSIILGNELYKLGYRGLVSVDCLHEKENLYPLIEINGRLSLSTFFVNLKNKYCDEFIKTILIDLYKYNTNYKFIMKCKKKIIIDKKLKVFFYLSCINESKDKFKLQIICIGNDLQLIDDTLQGFINEIKERTYDGRKNNKYS